MRSAIATLYGRHAGLLTFTYKHTSYSTSSLNGGLETCHGGGATSGSQAQEATRLAACASLIAYFYNYAQQAKVPEALDVARELYGYAATHITSPFNGTKVLVGLLRALGSN